MVTHHPGKLSCYLTRQDAECVPAGCGLSYLMICTNEAIGLTPSTPLKESVPVTVSCCAVAGAVIPTTTEIVCGATSGVPPFRLPPKLPMLQTMLFTAMPFNTPGAGARQVSTPRFAGMALGTMLVMVNVAGSEMVKVTPVTTVAVVLFAVNAWVVVPPLFSCGLPELAVTGIATVGPGPPCGGACGVAMVKADEPVTGLAAASVAVNVDVPVTLFAMILTMIFTLTVAPAARVPMLQETVVAAAAPQVPWPVRATTMFAPSGVA